MTNQVHIGDSVGDNNNVRRDDINMPLRRPTTPMTNLSSSTSNSQIFLGGTYFLIDYDTININYYTNII